MTELINLLRHQKCKVVYSSQYQNEWTDEELCNNIIRLYCPGQNLTVLPNIPSCIILDCSSNDLTFLPDLLQCQDLNC